MKESVNIKEIDGMQSAANSNNVEKWWFIFDSMEWNRRPLSIRCCRSWIERCVQRWIQNSTGGLHQLYYHINTATEGPHPHSQRIHRLETIQHPQRPEEWGRHRHWFSRSNWRLRRTTRKWWISSARWIFYFI